MARTLLCEIVTPERIVYTNEVEMVVAPDARRRDRHPAAARAARDAAAARRAPRQGTTTKDAEWFAISGGYLQVHEDKVIVLADRATLASQIDVERAREARDAIEARLKGLPERDESVADELKWYDAQIAVGTHAK